MRRIVSILPVFLALALDLLPAQENDTVDWLDNYKQAIQEAKRTRKPIFLEFRCEA